MTHFIRTADDVEAALAASESGRSWILKHSNACGVSAEAFSEFAQHAEAHPGDPHWVLTVQNNPALSGALTRRLGTEHETPQVILVMEGRVRWMATHWDVTVEGMDEGLASVL